MSEQWAHAYQCQCGQCRAMAAAIGSQYKGEYFFSDEELLRIAELNNNRCDCADCQALRTFHEQRSREFEGKP